MSMTAIEKSSGKMIPIAESSTTRRVFTSISVSQTVMTPTAAAPVIKRGDDMSPVAKNARTIPSRIVWVIESDIIAIFRSTRKAPGSAHDTEMITAMS